MPQFLQTEMSSAVDAKEFDPDLLPWERQPDEPDDHYAMFLHFRDLERRSLAEFTKEQYQERGWTNKLARKLSSRWSWGFRCARWDRYMGQVDTEELVRYRRSMNDRQRNAARLAQQKIAQWLVNLDPSTLRPFEAARWFEIAVKMERDAAGVDAPTPPQPDGPTDPAEHEPGGAQTLAELAGIDQSVEADLAVTLFEVLRRRKP
jgi:hypothetical protein